MDVKVSGSSSSNVGGGKRPREVNSRLNRSIPSMSQNKRPCPKVMDVYDWLRNENMTRTKRKGVVPESKAFTHLILNPFVCRYGKVLVPPDRLLEFYAKYVESWDRGQTKLYFVEQAPKEDGATLPLMFDLDVYYVIQNSEGESLSSTLGNVVLEQLIPFIQNAVKTAFPRDRCRMILGTRESNDCDQAVASLNIPPWMTLLEDEKRSPIISVSKIGAHLHFPDIRVTRKSYMSVRNLVVHQLRSNLEYDLLTNHPDHGQLHIGILKTWEDVVDRLVVKNCNLRMYGSRKAERCKCGSKPSVSSSSSSSSSSSCVHVDGMIDTGKVYELHGVCAFATDGGLDTEKTTLYQGDAMALLKDVSLLWMDPDKPKDATPLRPGFSDADLAVFSDKALSRSLSEVVGGMGKGKEKGSGGGGGDKKEETLKRIVSVVTQLLPEDEVKFDVILPQWNAMGTQLQSVIVPVTSRFCGSMGREHHNNSCYVVVSVCLWLCFLHAAASASGRASSRRAASLGCKCSEAAMTRAAAASFSS